VLATLGGSGSQAIEIWRRNSGERLGVLHGHTSHTNGMALIDGGKTLLSASVDRTLGVWDLSRFHNRLRISSGANILTCLATSKDGRTVAAGSRDGTICLFRAASSQELDAVGW
jgi:WD40 repeat protein